MKRLVNAQVSRWATQAYLLVMASVFLLFTGTDGYILLGWKKLLFFAVATGAWLCALLPGAVCACAASRRVRLYRTDIIIFLFALAAVLSAVLSPQKRTFFSYETGRYDGLGTYLLYCAVLSGVSHCGKPGKLLLYVFAAAYTACCCIAAAQLFGRNALGLYPDDLNYYAPYVQEYAPFLGTVGNIDLLSALHCLALPALTLTVLLGQGGMRFILLLPIALGLGCMLSAGVSSGILALCVTAAALLTMLPLLLHDRFGLFPGRGRKALLLAGLIPVMLCVALLLLTVRILPMPEGTLSELQSLLRGHADESFGSHRIAIWKDCLRVFGKHPVFGVGPDRLGDLLSVRFQRYSALAETEITAVVDNAHNEYLQHLCCFGLAGFVPLFLLQLKTLADHFRCGTFSAERSILFAACFCYMVQAFFNIGLCITTPLVCMVWGLLLGSENEQRGERAYPELRLPWQKMKLNFYAQTNIGGCRANNEDNYCLCGFFREDISVPTQEYSGAVRADGAFFGVFDGMGGGENGEQASLLASQTAKRVFGDAQPNARRRFYAQANAEICAYTGAKGLRQCGTTAVVLETLREGFCVSNVGDSRAYLLRDGMLRRLTQDDTEHERLKALGVAAPGGKNLLTQYVGIPPEDFIIEPHCTETAALHPGDRFLLCSDGLTGYLDEAAMLEILRTKATPKQAAVELIETALDNGETDNITAVVVDVEKERFSLFRRGTSAEI